MDTDGTRTALTIAREARGWSQRDLAERSGVAQPTLSKAERGLAPLNPGAVDAVARALDVPGDFLTRLAPSLAAASLYVHHRRRASTMTLRVVHQIEAIAQLTANALAVLTEDVDLAPQHELPTSGTLGADPVRAADTIRATWRIADGPVRHVTGLIESAGVIVVDRDLFSAGQDALSARLAQGPAAMTIVSRGLAPDRLRFTLAHELGHLLLHTTPGEGQEPQADAFAAQLLAPADQIRPELEGLRTTDLDRLLTIKERWGISVAALIRRAHQLSTITDRQYREFQIRLGRAGWRQAEPRQPDRELPTTAQRLIALREANGDTVPAMADRAGMTPRQFMDVFLASRSTPRQTLTLRQDPA